MVPSTYLTLQALQRTRVAYGHAYCAQTNKHAEVTGKRLDGAIRRFSAEMKKPWTEVVNRAIIAYNETHGPTGYTPYEVIFGRKRPNGCLQMPSDGTTADMEQFVNGKFTERSGRSWNSRMRPQEGV